jgi:hypothetical protein
MERPQLGKHSASAGRVRYPSVPAPYSAVPSPWTGDHCSMPKMARKGRPLAHRLETILSRDCYSRRIRFRMARPPCCVSPNLRYERAAGRAVGDAFLEQSTCYRPKNSTRTRTSISGGRKARRPEASARSFYKWRPLGSKLLKNGIAQMSTLVVISLGRSS